MTPDMTEKEYFELLAINSTSLADFNISQDHALMSRESKSYFNTGHVYEDMLRDAATGSTFFEDRYFVADVDGKMPDELIGWLEKGENLEQYIEFNKDGITRNATKKTKHAFIDACIANPGKLPISIEEFGMCQVLVKHMLLMELLGTDVKTILSNCMWQKPVVWEYHGFKKKALFDCVMNIDDETYCFDIKTSANPASIKRFLNSKYWIQDCHYSEGAEVEWGNVKGFYFLVAFKEAPYLCQPFQICGGNQYEYTALVDKYIEWLKAGKPERGWLDLERFYNWKK
jgi:hypothetical protein